jgi:hypothetical protein
LLSRAHEIGALAKRLTRNGQGGFARRLLQAPIGGCISYTKTWYGGMGIEGFDTKLTTHYLFKDIDIVLLKTGQEII